MSTRVDRLQLLLWIPHLVKKLLLWAAEIVRYRKIGSRQVRCPNPSWQIPPTPLPRKILTKLLATTFLAREVGPGIPHKAQTQQPLRTAATPVQPPGQSLRRQGRSIAAVQLQAD